MVGTWNTLNGLYFHTNFTTLLCMRQHGIEEMGTWPTIYSVAYGSEYIIVKASLIGKNTRVKEPPKWLVIKFELGLQIVESMVSLG